MKNRCILLLVLISFGYYTYAQPREAKEIIKKVNLPDIPGFKTLKCDFHMHTVFSDGTVWPIFRVDEALRDGLDAISLTEHTDYERFPEDIKRDINRSYDLAADYAKGKGILIIKGAEISPRVQPYHNNVLFLRDMNLPYNYMKVSKTAFVMKDKPTHEELMAPFIEAQKQGGFISYNHPGNMPAWAVRDTAVFTAFHQELYDKKMLSGIEVVNGGIYNVTAHRLAMKYNLTMLCNTDEHGDMYPRYANTHRPMTLVFAKDKSEDAIKEALIAKRTALYFDNYIIARQPEAEAFFKSSVSITTTRGFRKGKDEPSLIIKLMNNSDITYHIQVSSKYVMDSYPLGQIILQPNKETNVLLRAMWKYPDVVDLKLAVSNVLISPDNCLQTIYSVKVE